MTTKVRWWHRLKCLWSGHTYRPKDGTYTGTLLHVLHNSACIRCHEPFADAFNRRTR